MALVAAFLMDLFIGDPPYRFHPVRLMGHAIESMETFLRRRIQNEKTAGAWLAFSLPVMVYGISWILLWSLEQIHSGLAWLVQALLIYTTISIHDLKKEALRIYHDLQQEKIDQARRDLARIV